MSQHLGAEFIRRTPGTKEAVDKLRGVLGSSTRSAAIRDAIAFLAYELDGAIPAKVERIKERIEKARGCLGVTRKRRAAP